MARTIKEGASWFVVSRSYRPASLGSVGAGTKWAEPHKTRTAARIALAQLKARYGQHWRRRDAPERGP